MPTRRATLGTAAALAGSAALTTLRPTPATAEARPTATTDRPLIGEARGALIHAMTFNIRLRRDVTESGQPDHWGDRAPLVTRLLRAERPTLLGVQEALYPQLAVIEAALPEHEMVGYGRSGGSNGEYSAIFYDARRFDVAEWDQYWLSDTPDTIGSTSWGNTITRIVTWARLRDRRTGRQLVHLNTHFDHQSENARRLSAQVMRDQLLDLDLPTVVTGDFNAGVDSEPFRLLAGPGAPAVDTWSSARRRLTREWGTFPNYRPPVEGGNRIDWVLASPDVEVLQAAINPTSYDTAVGPERWPSDHTPVQALLRLAR